MATVTGCEGTVKIDDGGGLQLIGELSSYEIAESANVKQYKTISGDCTDKTKDLGTSYTISLEGSYDPLDPGQLQLGVGKLVAFEIYPAGEEIGDPLYSGNIRISELSQSASPDDDITFSISSIGDGALIKANTY